MKKSILTAALLLLTGVISVSAEEVIEVSAEINSGGKISVKLEIPEGQYVYEESFAVKTNGVKLNAVSSPVFKTKVNEISGEDEKVYANTPVFVYALSDYSNYPVTVTVYYHRVCEGSECFMPMSTKITLASDSSGSGTAVVANAAPPAAEPSDLHDLEILGKGVGYLDPDSFIEFLDKAESGSGPDKDRLEQILEKYGVFAAVLFILVFGFLLNLTPCVLPMIPINIAIIGAGAQSESKRRGFLLGAIYGLGISVVYGALGLAVVLTGSQFGTLQSQWWFNISIAVVFLILALAMFDVFSIDLSRFQGNAAGGLSRGKFVTAFILGGTSALLAGACVAPVLISVLLLATRLHTAGNPAGLILPFILGIGMALPWPFAGAGLSFLPKPGRWMESIKKLFGVLILAFAVWYGYLGWSLLRPSDTTGESEHKDGWYTSVPAALEASRKEGKPVFLDFWATWCKVCSKMDKNTFKDPAVVKRLDSYIKLKYQAEDMGSPSVKPTLDHFKVTGLPTYIVLAPKE